MKNTPILNTLQDYLSKEPIRLHVPFHSGIANNNIFPKEIYNLDISEVSGYDVEGKDNPIFQSEKITADYFSVSHSFYLTGGASSGLLASMIALNKYGKKVILARNVHKSVINGLVLAGLEPVWLDVDFIDEWGIFSRVNPEKLNKILQNDKNLAGCVIVSPTYEGMISDVKEISMLCHKKDIPLIVDEAQGAHLRFLNNKNLYSAIQLGADLVVQSWHKSLGSLTQSGVLHLVNENYFAYSDIKRSLDLVSSTSPSFLLLVSLELTRKYLQDTRGEIFIKLYERAQSFREKLNCLQNNDPFKIYLKYKNISGINLAYELYAKYSIEIESANEIGLLLLIGASFNDEIADRIIFAINDVSCRGLPRQAPTNVKPNAYNGSLLSPREAFLKGFQEKDLKFDTDIIAPCPPGYATNIPGNKKC